MSLSLVSCKSRRHDTPQTPLPPTSPRGERRGFWSRPTAGVVRPPYGRRFTLRLARAHRDAFSLRSTHRSMCAQLGSRTASRLFALSLRSAQQHERRYVGTTAISGSALTALQRVSPPRPSRGARLWYDEARRLAYTYRLCILIEMFARYAKLVFCIIDMVASRYRFIAPYVN